MKGFSLQAVRTLCLAAVGNAELAVVNFKQQAGSMSKSDKRLYGTIIAMGALHGQAFAQAGVATTLDNVKTTVLNIGQAIFAIFLMIGLVKTAKKFIGGEPDAMTSLMWLVGGVLLFFGFQALKGQIVTNTGGGAGGVQ